MMPSPLVETLLSDAETPVSLFYKLARAASTAFLFESAEGDRRVARFSFMGVDPRLTVRFEDGEAVIEDARAQSRRCEPCEDPTALLARLAAEFLPDAPEKTGALKTFPFTAGWVGVMGYGATRYYENIPQQALDPQGAPDGAYALYESVIVFDHLYRRLYLISYAPADEAANWMARVRAALGDRAAAPPLLPFPAEGATCDPFAGVQSAMGEAAFKEGVAQAQGYIQEGQAFQIVLSHRFYRPVSASSLDIYRTLQAVNPSPYAYFLKFPGFDYLGSSPETYASCLDGQVTLRALAGTRPRGATPEEDAALAASLLADEKELAEHRMLVDLGRNDLGRTCVAGTVETGEVGCITWYAHVMHLTTEISGRLRPGKSAYDVFRCCFPRGTVSGAPKIRAMELLAQMERERRGFYAGAVGYFDITGNMDGAIAIRSALIRDGVAHINAGAGLVADSTPEGEWQETRNKARSTLMAIALAEKMAVSTPAPEGSRL
ncbi:MAG: chorismate-binding protein [Vampirovibrionales bacterium]|nr:chorismate-binding protein [Vampirovibrionales bacterium]